MHTIRWASILLALAPSAGCGKTEEARAPAQAALRDIIRTGPVRGLVLARPFTTAEPYVHHWRLEEPAVRSGWLVVLEVDPSYVEPHQTAMPVLLFGDQTAECVNFGQDSGRVIAIVPEIDLAASPAWFGPPELPERVDAAWIAVARARARPADVVTFTAAEIAAARKLGGAAIVAADRVGIEREAAQLILEHSPRERELAEGLLVPVTR